MKANLLKSIILMFLILFFSINAYAESDDIKEVKESLLKTLNSELLSLQSWGIGSKDNPEKELQRFKSDNSWNSFYSEWSSEYSYDIKKTDSIVSPYMGIVTFYGKVWWKRGNTVEGCLNANWQIIGDSTATLKYLYQEGKWILKETPPVYKRY
jgi:hypothetical protein